MKGERTCIGCRMKAEKSALHRIVRRPDGMVGLDEGSKASGRGAYVCSAACLDKVVQNGRLASALRTSISADALDCIFASPVWGVATAPGIGEE